MCLTPGAGSQDVTRLPLRLFLARPIPWTNYEEMHMNYDWLDGYALAKPGAAEEFKVAWDALLYRVGDRMYGMKGCYKDGRPLCPSKWPL